MLVRTPRVFWIWKGISGSVEFALLRKTPRTSRHDLVSPAMWCECAMEPIGARWAGAAAICQSFLARCPLLASRTGSGLPCAGSEARSGRRTCKGWPKPAAGAKISRSSHESPEKGYAVQRLVRDGIPK